MTPADLETLLASLINAWETEVVEFKEAGADYKTRTIGKYFSALANEANLRGQEKAWLVFGVNNRNRAVTHTDYRMEPERLQGTKQEIADGTEPRMTFPHIHAFEHSSGGRVVMFEIPAAPAGMPVSWNGHYYARNGASLGALGFDKQDKMRNQTREADWSAQAAENATLDDLDETAIQKAREAFAVKHANRFTAEEIADWSTASFLDRAKVTRHGNITRTAILLLGKPESAHLLSHSAQLTWKLTGPERAYEHFGPPFFLSTTQLYRKIRNVQIRLLPKDQLVAHEIAKYDRKIVLEAMHNCIAHQDYGPNGRILVIEHPDKLVFENVGQFYEGSPDDYVLGERTPRHYRNPFLVEAMVSLNMIDKMGYGIHDMHRGQRRRYFPMPDYDFSEPNVVRMTLYGSVVDPAYTQMLMQKTDLDLVDVLALDKVQKKLPIPEDAIARLRHLRLIEGRKPHFHISAQIAAATGSKADYIRTRAQDNAHYTKLITDYLEKFGKASRKEIDDLVKKHLSEALSDYQKDLKVGNLLTKLRMSGVIHNAGSKAKPEWMIVEKRKKELSKEKERIK